MLDIQKNVSLDDKTTFRIGGKARFFAAVKTERDLEEALEYAKHNNLEYFILGGGSNVLFSSRGFSGLVIKMKIDNLEVTNGITIQAGSGVPLAKVVRTAIENELSGMEWAAGIPGTVGGAVRGNAGAYGESMSKAIGSVRVLDADRFFSEDKRQEAVRDYLPQDCRFDYRSSIFKQNKNLIILSVKIKLEKGIKEEIVQKSKENIQKRIAGQPIGIPSAGSFFMNPETDNPKIIEAFEKDRGVVARGGKIPAGWLIDQSGLKGKKIGGAQVSEKHPNFLVNTGQAKAEDVIMLESLVKQQVRDQFDIQLQSEVEHAGF